MIYGKVFESSLCHTVGLLTLQAILADIHQIFKSGKVLWIDPDADF